jgi:hypothetical protein
MHVSRFDTENNAINYDRCCGEQLLVGNRGSIYGA